MHAAGNVLAGVFGGLFGGIPVDENHVSCTMCRSQMPKQSAPPVPTRCQFCAKTLCDACPFHTMYTAQTHTCFAWILDVCSLAIVYRYGICSHMIFMHF
jgi:hypothetical protein